MNMKMFLTSILLFHCAFSSSSYKYEKKLREQSGLFRQPPTFKLGNRYSILAEDNEVDEEPEVEEEENLPNRLIEKEMYGLTESDIMDEWIKKTVELNEAKLMHESMEKLIQKLVELDDLKEIVIEKEKEIEELKQEITQNMEENSELKNSIKTKYEIDELESEVKLLEEKMQSVIVNGKVYIDDDDDVNSNHSTACTDEVEEKYNDVSLKVKIGIDEDNEDVYIDKIEYD